MKRQRKWKINSDATERADIKNRAETFALHNVKNVELRYHKNRLHELESEIKLSKQHLKEIKDVCPVSYAQLCVFHDNMTTERNEIYTHIIKCYMERQEENVERWRKQKTRKGPPKYAFVREEVNRHERSQGTQNYLDDLPVKPQDHILFIAKSFPEVLKATPDAFQTDKSNQYQNIYQCPRASHNRTCFSTRIQPIGNYPMRVPINFKKFNPEHPPAGWPKDSAIESHGETFIKRNFKTEGLTGQNTTIPQLPILTGPQNSSPQKKKVTAAPEKLPDIGGILATNILVKNKKERSKEDKKCQGSLSDSPDSSMARQLNFKLPKLKNDNN